MPLLSPSLRLGQTLSPSGHSNAITIVSGSSSSIGIILFAVESSGNQYSVPLGMYFSNLEVRGLGHGRVKIMIALSFEVPPKYAEKTGRGPIVWIIVLEPDNLERMKQADPADIQPLMYMQGPMLNAPIKQLDLVIAYEEDLDELRKLNAGNDTWGIIRWLERGRKIMKGDLSIPIPLGEKK